MAPFGHANSILVQDFRLSKFTASIRLPSFAHLHWIPMILPRGLTSSFFSRACIGVLHILVLTLGRHLFGLAEALKKGVCGFSDLSAFSRFR
jgi:hypothetical protein